MNSGKLALAADNVLSNPQLTAELGDAIRSRMSAHATDQVDAAIAEAFTCLNAVKDTYSGPVTGSLHEFRDAPEWLRLGFLDTMARFVTGTADTCLHSPHHRSPQPVIAAACKPGLVVCPRCIHLLSMPTGSVEDSTCDACGHICGRPEDGDGIFPGISQYGVLIYMYGICGDCHPQPDVPRKDPSHRLGRR